MDTHQHHAALVIGDGGRDLIGRTYVDYTDIRGERCMECWLINGMGPEPLGCLQAASLPLTIGTLVQTLPAPRWHRVPARTGVVVLATSTMAVVWMWSIGHPDPERTLFTVAAHEVTPMLTTLEQLPELTYGSLYRVTESAHDTTHRGLLSPLLHRLNTGPQQ
ncbi:hypothetical protein [Streptomyces sp. NPDC001108]